MRSAQNRAVARQFADNLRNVLDDCSAQVDDLNRSFEKGPMGTSKEAKEFGTKMLSESEQLRIQVPQLYDLIRGTPRLDEMLDAGFDQLAAINNILDIYEDRLEEAYGIEAVKLSSSPITSPNTPLISSSVITTYENIDSIQKSTYINGTTPLKTFRTPRKKNEPQEDIPMPATPRMEDFGISADDLKMLSVHSPDEEKKTISNAEIDETVRTILDENMNYNDSVNEAMCTLGIETPAQITQRYEMKRYSAMKGVMQGTTPRIKGSVVEEALSYAKLADEYYPSMEIPNTSRKTLKFEESPQQANVKSEIQLRRQVSNLYPTVDGFWKSQVSCEIMQNAAQAFSTHTGRIFTRTQLSEFLENVIPGKRHNHIMLGLAKLKVLKIEIRDDDNVYQVV